MLRQTFSVDLTCIKRSVQSLNFAFNELQTLPKEVMQDFDELRNLSLKHNGILEVDIGSFSKQNQVLDSRSSVFNMSEIRILEFG